MYAAKSRSVAFVEIALEAVGAGHDEVDVRRGVEEFELLPRRLERRQPNNALRRRALCEFTQERALPVDTPLVAVRETVAGQSLASYQCRGSHATSAASRQAKAARKRSLTGAVFAVGFAR